MDTTKTVTHVGLCAGYGGIELGLRRVLPSLRSVALCEIEAFAVANLVAKMEAGLMDPAPVWPDLKTFPWAAFHRRVDILTGGYPCQPFSAAGKRAGTEDPRHLWPWIADGIAVMQPRICFFENVDGHISLGLSTVISDLEELGYSTTWGVFSAAECGAPHQRKRVFILAHRIDSGLEGLTGHGVGVDGQGWISQGQGRPAGACSLQVWPAKPGEQQRGWEPPRVVANSDRVDRSAQAEGREHDGQAGPAGRRGLEPALGLHTDECSGALGQTLTLIPYVDNVHADENVSKKARAREVLFELWQQAGTEAVQWETRRLQCFLEEKVLRSGVQLDAFTQRICFFVWCLQAGHKAQGWGLRGMHIYESSRGSSQGQEPIEQFKRELGYAMCQLSYEIALERGENRVETEGIMQGVRESSERAWALSQALPEMEEVWRSALNQTVWENGCFIEAASKGNRTDELRLLGNGVVPATAAKAFRVLAAQLLNLNRK